MSTTPSTAARPIRVMIVDDSVFMRKAVEAILKSAGGFEVCAAVASGESALSQLDTVRPDCITMDVEMPGMGGLQAVKAIMAKRRTPILMLSSLTARGTEVTLQALENGAADVVAKPGGGFTDMPRISAELITKLRALGRRPPVRSRLEIALEAAPERSSRPAAKATGTATAATPSDGAPFAALKRFPTELIAIGISTGGPAALSQVLSKISPAVKTPIVIVQHMPPGFTKALAERLNSQCPLEVVEAENDMPILPGRVIVGVSGKQLRVHRAGGQGTVTVDEPHDESLYMPSADVLFRSCAATYGRGTLALIMTGMGNDGTAGLKDLVKTGAYVYGQDEASCVVYGMPRMASEAGVVNTLLPLEKIAAAIDAADKKYVA